MKIEKLYHEQTEDTPHPESIEQEQDVTFEAIEYAENGTLLNVYNQILQDPQREIGSGNNAIVFSTVAEVNDQLDAGKRKLCIKAIWSKLHSDIAGNEFSQMPSIGQNLRRFAERRDEIKGRKRELVSQGIMFRDQVDPETEALNANRAHVILKNAGSEVSVPWVSRIINIERSESVYNNDDGVDIEYPYSFGEKVDLLVMNQVSGVNIEEMILGNDRFSEIRDKIDFETLRSQLEQAIKTLHEHGITHQDISTRNIMITTEGLPVLIDFGTSHFSEGVAKYEGQEHDEKDLEKTLRWLRKYLDDSHGTSAELRESLDNIRI